MKKLVSIGSTVLLLSVLAGCSAPAISIETQAPVAVATPMLTPEPTPLPTPEPTPEPTINPATYKKSCVKLDYNTYARNPDKYGEKNVYFTGTVVQVIEDGSYIEMRVAVNDDYDKMIYVSYLLTGDRILEDDTVTIYGTTKGLITYESTMGGNITIPFIVAMYITIK